MGQIENKYSTIKKRKDVQRIILGVVASVGIISVGLMAPNILGAMAKLGLVPTKRQKDSIRVARDTLVRKGYLKYEHGKLYITKVGRQRLNFLQNTENGFPKPRKWDHRWRVLIFDIPEYQKSIRDKVRRTLSSVGFIRLQDSVWVYPYACEDFITLLKADFKIGKNLLYMIVDMLENDTSIRKHFNLPESQ